MSSQELQAFRNHFPKLHISFVASAPFPGVVATGTTGSRRQFLGGPEAVLEEEKGRSPKTWVQEAQEQKEGNFVSGFTAPLPTPTC